MPYSLSLLAKAGAEAFFGWWSKSLLLFPVCKCPGRTAAKLFPLELQGAIFLELFYLFAVVCGVNK